MTVDADGGAGYTSLDSVLNAIQLGRIDPDTVEFIGSNQNSYSWSEYVDKNIGRIIFRGHTGDPAKFPIINHSKIDVYNFFNVNSVSFENCILKSSIGFHLGQENMTRTFKRCIIRECNASYAFNISGGSGGSTTFENCLFTANTATNIFKIYIWGGMPTFRLINCTFDNNTSIFDTDPDTGRIANFSITNCIFSNNATTFRGNNLRGKTTYSLTSESLTGYGIGCVSNSDPRYSVASSRSAPIVWRPLRTSPARHIGIVTGAPTVDLSDAVRVDTVGKRDAGCWDIIIPPVILIQPENNTVVLGTAVVFKVKAAEMSVPLSYNWIKISGSSNPVSSSDSFKITATVPTDDSTFYYCVVSNGRDSVSSNTVLLRVVEKPVFNTHPKSITVYAGDTVEFTVAVSGIGVTYSWKKDGTTISGATSPAYKLPNVALGDSGLYICYASNIAGTDSSSPALLRVLPPAPKIISKTEDATLPEGSSITLKVEAQGKQVLHYVWKKAGDTATLGKTDSLTLQGLKQNEGAVYRCIVSNAWGKDSADIKITVTAASISNPLTLTATFVDPTRISLTIKNYLGLPFTAGAAPFVDTIGVWYSTLTFPSGTLLRTASNLVKIPLRQMRADSDNSYDTVIQYIATPPDSCKSLYLVASPFWNKPDTILPAASGAQSVKIFMCSTDTLINRLNVDVAYKRVADSMMVTIGNLTSINRDSLMYIVLQYRIGAASSFFADSTIKIYPADLPEAPANLLTRTIRDSRLAGVEDSLTVRVFWRGRLGNTSVPPVMKTIGIGRLRPLNTATLFIDSTTTSSIYTHWKFEGTADFDTLRLWWGRDSVPLAADFTPGIYTAVPLNKSVTSFVISGLISGVRYGVGLQVGKESVWSFVTVASRDTATTKPSFQATISNTIKIVSCFFDTNTNLINVAWNIDTTGIGPLSGLETGIVWAVGTFPAKAVPTDCFGKIVLNLKTKDNSEKIDLGEELVFSSTYYIALLLRRKGDIAWAEATDSSVGTAVVPKESWQKVVYFTGTDTMVTAFNRKVVLWKSGSGTVSVVDTIRVFNPPSPPRGFAVAGRIGIDFVNDVKSDPINIGLRYNPSLPGGLTPADIRMYQYSPDSGWRVIDECAIDTVQQIVSVTKRTSEYRNPFILMIDTLRPAVSILSDTGSPVFPKTDIVDTIVIADNVSNSTARVFYWRVDGAGNTAGQAVSCKTEKDTVRIAVPGSLISDDYGVRALLVVSDGRFAETADLSRKVIRSLSSKSDDIVLRAKRWTPLYTTTLLNSRSMEKVLDELGNADKWEYDSMRFRIFRWIDTASVRNGAAAVGADNWVEYRPADSLIFQLVPGRVFWIKTFKDITVKLGEGTTASMKEPYAITLNANDWTDIALPYKFNVKIGDILKETSSDTAVTNRIQIYKWEMADGSGAIVSRQKHIPGIPFLDSSASALACNLDADGIGTYTLFNASPDDIILKIPPLPEMYSSFSVPVEGTRKIREASEWSIVVDARTDNGRMTPVYCGFRPGVGVSGFPAAPSFNRQRVMVVDPRNNRGHGNLVYHEADEGGFVFPLKFVNEDGQTVRFDYDIIIPANLPSSYRTGVYDPAIQRIDYSNATKTLSVDGHAEAYRWLLVGDSSYMTSWRVRVSADLALLRVSPNPCRGAILIKFNVPYDDVTRIQVALFNQLGRCIWQKALYSETLHPGLNELLLQPSESGTIAAGTYIIRLTAITGKNKLLGIRQQKVIYLPW